MDKALELLQLVEKSTEEFSWDKLQAAIEQRKPYAHNQAFLLVGKQALESYASLVDCVFSKHEREVNSLKSLRTIIDEHLEAVAKGKNARSDTKISLRSMRERATAEPEEEFLVSARIHGVAIHGLKEPIHIGRLTLAAIPEHSETIYGPHSMVDQNLFELEPGQYACVRVSSRSPKWAVELAYREFRLIESAFRIATNLSDRLAVRIGGLPDIYSRTTLGWSETRFISSRSTENLSPPLQLKKETLAPTSLLHKTLFACMAPNPSELQARIKRAIHWLGEAAFDAAPSGAFVKAATALETMLVMAKPAAISASIMAQISEQVAHIMGRTLKEKLEIEATVKSLYGERSKITHSGSHDVGENQLFRLFNIVSRVINRFLSDKQLSKLTTQKQLDDFFRSRKYVS